MALCAILDFSTMAKGVVPHAMPRFVVSANTECHAEIKVMAYARLVYKFQQILIMRRKELRATLKGACGLAMTDTGKMEIFALGAERLAQLDNIGERAPPRAMGCA